MHSPIKAIEQGWIKSFVDSEMIKRNGIEFRLVKVYRPDSIYSNTFELNADDTKKELEYTLLTCEDKWTILPQSSYMFESNLELDLPRDVVAILYTRNTLVKNGVFLTSDLLDSGYRGFVGGHIHTLTTKAVIQKKSRIGHIVFQNAASGGIYKRSEHI